MPHSLHVQVLHGLALATTFPLHQDRPAPPGTVPDVTVREGPPMAHTLETPGGRVLLDFGENPDRWYTAVERPDGSVLLRVYTVCDFVVSADQGSVEMRMVEGTDPGMGAILTCGTLVALLLQLRGSLVLHASGVELGDTVIAFLGHSGMGKSTLAALMCTAGARVVTDDVLPILPGPVPTVLPGATELRLRPGAESLTADLAAGTFRQRQSTDNRQVIGLEGARGTQLPLGAIVLPRPNRENHLEMEVLEGKAALFAVLTFPRLMGWRDESALARTFAQVSTVVRTVPVFVAHVPWGPPFRSETVPMIRSAVLDRAAHLGAGSASR